MTSLLGAAITTTLKPPTAVTDRRLSTERNKIAALFFGASVIINFLFLLFGWVMSTHLSTPLPPSTPPHVVYMKSGARRGNVNVRERVS